MTNYKAFRRFAKDNKGSAVLTVVITMMFVVALGTALLYSAYCGLKLSVLARKDKENFYDASFAMDEIKAGVQDEVCSALNKAYNETLVAYGKDNMKDLEDNETSDPQEAFRASFLTSLDRPDDLVFDVYYDPALKKSTVSVNIDALKAFASTESWEKIELIGESEAEVSDEGFTISDLELTCVSKDGYKSNIETDLNIAIPRFFTGSAVSSDIGRYAIIANKGITTSKMGDKTIMGGVYAGTDGISVQNSGDLNITGGKVITAGSISVVGNSSNDNNKTDTTLTIYPSNYDIWAREIEVSKDNSNSKLLLDGNIYIADDLVIGGGSDVTLKGNYYGFGSDDASTNNCNDENSSSILVNGYEEGKKASLNIKELNQLALGGVSFINVSKDTDAKENIPTGESIAVKTDQLAYLLPAEAISNYKTNPTVARKEDTGEYEKAKVNANTVLWSIDGEDKTVADYIGCESSGENDNDYVGKYGRIVSFFTQSPDKDPDPSIGYFFIDFTDQTMANQYFKDYFTAKPNSIEQYLDIYFDLSKYNPAMTEITKGNTYRVAGGGEQKNWENILGTAAFPDSQARYYKNIYKDLRASPLEDYIDRDKLSDLRKKTLKFKNGKGTVAVVSGEDMYTYDSNESFVQVIIAANDVTIRSPFNGIIIAGGTVTVDTSISEELPTSEILTSTTKDGVPLSDYLNEEMFNGEKSNSDNEWSPDRLVYYSNWQKN